MDARQEQAFARDGFEEGERDPGARRELGQREELLACAGVGGRGRHRGRERHVGRVDLAREQTLDQREREALPLQLADPGQPFEVLGAVPGDPALARGRRQQAPLLVEADRVDRHVGPPGQVLDTPPLHGQRL